MVTVIHPSEIQGSLRAPASKSVAQRAIAIAGITYGTSRIKHPGASQDVQAAVSVIGQLGAIVEETESGLIIAGGLRTPAAAVNCRESGLSVRMFSAIAATLDKEVVMTGEGSLMARPMDMIEMSLHALGVSCRSSAGRLPVRIRGPIKNIHAEIDASASSQVLTGLLIAAPLTGRGLHLHVPRLNSLPYIDTTLETMKAFGVAVEHHKYRDFHISAGASYRPAELVTEGDWSGAAFLLVAAAMSGSITLSNLQRSSTQADRAIADILQLAGARVEWDSEGIHVRRDELKGFEWDATHCPDLFPPLVALASCCRGTSRIRGVSRLHAKESDRAGILMKIFQQLGTNIRCEKDVMLIEGGQPKGGQVEAHGDHRMAMAAAIAATAASGPVTIHGAEAVSKSYPAFFNDLKKVCHQKSGKDPRPAADQESARSPDQPSKQTPDKGTGHGQKQA